jgi:hypothetical protein
LEIVRKLKPHDRFEIEWIDASKSDVLNIDLPLRNHTVETRQEEMGYFLCLQKGETWRDPHLVYCLRITDKNNPGAGQWQVTSVPVALIKRITPLTKKEVLRLQKTGKGGRRVRSRRYRRHTQRFSDGSVKFVD